MYVPTSDAMVDADVRSFVDAHHVAHLVTVGTGGAPDATLLPVLWEGDRLVAHMARANDHWRRITDGSPGLAIVTGADAYVSPSWYPSKAEHGRVVPTWNYSTVHLAGPVRVIDDVDWVLDLVTRLTDRHEAEREHRWRVSDAPLDFRLRSARAIVGVEMDVVSVAGKAKLSGNRSDADRDGVIAGLRRSGEPGPLAVADAMDSVIRQRS